MVPEGRPRRRRLDGDGALHLSWRVSGGPALSDAPAPGYGLRLIEGTVGHELAGRAERAFRGDESLGTLRIPVDGDPWPAAGERVRDAGRTAWIRQRRVGAAADGSVPPAALHW